MNRAPIECTECGKTHAWPELKFSPGDRVRIIDAERWFHHREKVGQIVTIVKVWGLLAMPCDEPEYLTDAGPGAIRQSRLEPATRGLTEAQQHIANHLRDRRLIVNVDIEAQLTPYNKRCLVGMIETGEISYNDLDAVGGAVLVSAVAYALLHLDDE